MKKFLLLGAAAMLAGSVNAQTITGKMTLDWEHSMKGYTAGGSKSCGQLGTKALIANKATGKVEVWDESGKLKEYDVNTWLTENKATINPDDDAAYTMGTAVSADEAGNIIVNLQFPGVVSSTKFVAIKPDGTMTYIGCEFPSPPDYAGLRSDRRYLQPAFAKVRASGPDPVPAGAAGTAASEAADGA